VKTANQLIRDYLAKDDKSKFIDVFPAMLGTNGQPRPDIFVGDRLHMNPKGYAIWTSIIGPYLDQD
jgi:lysophospholipase L1-like esterase